MKDDYATKIGRMFDSEVLLRENYYGSQTRGKPNVSDFSYVAERRHFAWIVLNCNIIYMTIYASKHSSPHSHCFVAVCSSGGFSFRPFLGRSDSFVTCFERSDPWQVAIFDIFVVVKSMAGSSISNFFRMHEKIS